MTSFIVANGDKTKFRGWGDEGPTWVDKIFDALHFARRADAERFCADDEDAWAILTIEEVERDRVQELLVSNAEYRDRFIKSETALENIARWDFSHWTPDTDRLALTQDVFGLMNYASAAKARLFDPCEFKVGEQPSNIEVTVMDISKIDWKA